jgi:hypothetical protein
MARKIQSSFTDGKIPPVSRRRAEAANGRENKVC